MSGQLHSLLRRQLKRCFGDHFRVPKEWAALVEAVHEAYVEFDMDRSMLERSLELSSQELLQAGSEMRAVFQAIPDMLFHLDNTGTILSCKAGTTSGLVLNPAALQGKRIQDVPDKAVGDLFQAAIQSVLREKKPVSIEYALETKGQTQVYEARLVPLMQHEIVVIIRNITRRKRVEAALRESEMQLRLALDSARMGMWDWDIRANHVTWSAGHEALWGYAAGEFPGTFEGYESRLHPDDVEVARRAGQKAMDEHSDYDCEYRVLWPDGTVRWIASRGHVFYDPDGQPTRMIGVAMDATERKRAEEALRMFKFASDHSADGVFWVDRNAKFYYVNDQACRSLGYTREELLQLGIFDIDPVFSKQQWENNWERYHCDRTTRHHSFESVHRRKDGSTFTVEIMAEDFMMDGVEKHVVFVRDITNHKLLEEKLRRSQKMEAFGQLAGGVAHDFNNILTIIQGNLCLLRTRPNSEAEKAEAIQQAEVAAERAANLTRQLLTFGRRQPMHLKGVDLNKVIADMTKMLQQLVGEHIVLETHFAAGGAPVFADANMIEQVLVNLAVNSRDAMPKGGKFVLQTGGVGDGAVAVPPFLNRKAGEFFRLSIADTGSGIQPEHLPHIFEPFFTTKEVGRGTGLGLATVFGIVQQHHGWIEVESKMDEGTSFHIYLPRLPKDKPVSANTATPAAARGGNETILLVEDETSVRLLMRLLLKRGGYTIHEAASGPEALEVWQQHRDAIQLLITDMIMPEGISGRELAERLLQDRKDLKVIYCSGYNDDVLGADSPLRNNPNFLEKPFQPNEFLQRVRACLDTKVS